MNEKRFAFVNDAAEREYKNLPKSIQIEFGTNLSGTLQAAIDYRANLKDRLLRLHGNLYRIVGMSF